MVFACGCLSRHADSGTEKWGAAVTNTHKCGCSFGTRQWVEAGRVLSCILDTWTLKVILLRAWKEKKKAEKKAFMF